MATNDAISLLKADHKEVSDMFERFETAREATKSKLATEICQALTVHAQVKEELFYPAAHEALGDSRTELSRPILHLLACQNPGGQLRTRNVLCIPWVN